MYVYILYIYAYIIYTQIYQRSIAQHQAQIGGWGESRDEFEHLYAFVKISGLIGKHQIFLSIDFDEDIDMKTIPR